MKAKEGHSPYDRFTSSEAAVGIALSASYRFRQETACNGFLAKKKFQFRLQERKHGTTPLGLQRPQFGLDSRYACQWIDFDSGLAPTPKGLFCVKYTGSPKRENESLGSCHYYSAGNWTVRMKKTDPLLIILFLAERAKRFSQVGRFEYTTINE